MERPTLISRTYSENIDDLNLTVADAINYSNTVGAKFKFTATSERAT